jgi:F420-dependent oxidoreductase-like protein
MKVGLHIADFTWDGGPPALGPRLGEIARRADEAGVDRISVMDHLWQIGHRGPPELEMLEAYTTLGFLAASTERVKLLTVVTAVVYREPGLLAKAVTTLDVLSGGRAMLGIGAAWNAAEARGLGLFFPPLAERYERLEEALRICRQMWSDDDGPFDGQHYHLGRTLNSPQSLSRPHPPILIGGSGERKTLPLVARYADACNLFATTPAEAKHKLDVLARHCEVEGRDPAEITKTILGGGDPVGDPDAFVADMEGYARLGIDLVEIMPLGPDPAAMVSELGEKVLPRLAELGPS